MPGSWKRNPGTRKLASLMLFASLAVPMNAPEVKAESANALARTPATKLARKPASTPSRTPAMTSARPRTLFHSHNDYELDTPLFSALQSGFDSVEADVWYAEDNAMVSHLGMAFKGTLENLYLKPLQKRVNQLGSVYGDGKPFYLWIDLKDGSQTLRRKLNAILNRYPMLTLFSGDDVVRGPVTVILSGNEVSKRNFIREYPIRRAARDSVVLDEWDPQGTDSWRWYALDWKKHFKWNGKGKIPATEKKKLSALISLVHEKNRRLRFWGAPDSENFWRVALDAGVDVLGTDSPDRLRCFAEEAGNCGSLVARKLDIGIQQVFSILWSIIELPNFGFR